MEYRRHSGEREWMFALEELTFLEETEGGGSNRKANTRAGKFQVVINAKNKINRAMRHTGMDRDDDTLIRQRLF